RTVPMQIAEDLTLLFGYAPPIPLTVLAQDLDTTVVEQHWGRQGLLGYSWMSDPQQRVIVVNIDQSDTVVRFTLAHALMHRVLHAHRRTNPLHLQPEAVNLTEMEANAGAGALLMPARWLAPRLEAWHRVRKAEAEPWDVDTLQRWRATAGPVWARDAGVSLTALGYRLIDLGVVSGEGAQSWRQVSPRWGA
ncbi:MAG: ImmA/IrrE family metallo-endopeptidase, partial [Clostridia bacterium]